MLRTHSLTILILVWLSAWMSASVWHIRRAFPAPKPTYGSEYMMLMDWSDDADILHRAIW
jgi:hypothetical protein